MHLLVSAPGESEFLMAEIRRRWPESQLASLLPDVVIWKRAPDPAPSCMPLVFCRQLLPDCVFVGAETISAWCDRIFGDFVGRLPELGPWRLHVFSAYGLGTAGDRRCRLIHEAVREHLRRLDRQGSRGLEDSDRPWTDHTSLIQVLLTSPNKGFVSVAMAPWLSEHAHWTVPFPRGETPVAVDKLAPSRAFAKLLEAERRLGREIRSGETCVDLGAAPGSWSYVAVQRGAQVLAVDRSPLREDLMRHHLVRFQAADAFSFKPAAKVDWLLCDVIAMPHRSAALLMDWLKAGWMRQFVVTLKFKGVEYDELERLKDALPRLCKDFRLVRLCANRNEACAMGTAVDGGPSCAEASAGKR
jgi:23S rRNA (cytidine2498-2'-O)-methyltransferase